MRRLARLNFETCVFCNIAVKDMRKREYKISTCVWSKKLDLDMHLVINSIIINNMMFSIGNI